MNDPPRKQPSPPRPATTVLLLRPSETGNSAAPLEVFMVVRHHEIDSFSGALVFVGINALVTVISYLVIVKEIKRVELKDA